MMPRMTATFVRTLLFAIFQTVAVSARPLIALIILVSIPNWSRANNLQDQLNSEYKDKNLLLRSFYSGDNLAYDQNGDLRVVDTRDRGRSEERRVGKECR